jgi:uncharacterized protein
MPAYLHPGVYIEEIPSSGRPIEAVATATAVFIGYTPRGPLGVPTRLSKWEDYDRIYGGLTPANDGTADHLEMGLALQAFFLNGGGATYIVRLAKQDTAEKATADSGAGEQGDARLAVEAIDEGAWGNELRVRLERKTATPTMATLVVERGAGDEWDEVERFTGVWDAADPNCFRHRVNVDSTMIRVTEFTNGDDETLKEGLVLTGGTDGEAPDQAAYKAAFATLEKNREISIVCLPGQAWDEDGKAIVEEALAHASKVKSRMVLIDPPAGKELTDGTAVDDMGLSTSDYAVLYYPWVDVGNPAYDPERNPGATRTLSVAPSAFAAGMYAKIDSRRGVWKAPAGVESALLGVAKLQYAVDDSEQDELNPRGINCLRTMPGYGNVIWGARTLATKADPAWRYVPVRRTAIMIEQSIYNAIQWAVFEPNDEPLWSSLRTNIGSFMNGLFRSGAFQGGTANDAYFVRCGLGDTMTQGDIDRGQVIVVVGFAPLKPAEFVIIRIQQKVAKQ